MSKDMMTNEFFIIRLQYVFENFENFIYIQFPMIGEKQKNQDNLFIRLKILTAI